MFKKIEIEDVMKRANRMMEMALDMIDANKRAMPDYNPFKELDLSTVKPSLQRMEDVFTDGLKAHIASGEKLTASETEVTIDLRNLTTPEQAAAISAKQFKADMEALRKDPLAFIQTFIKPCGECEECRKAKAENERTGDLDQFDLAAHLAAQCGYEPSWYHRDTMQRLLAKRGGPLSIFQRPRFPGKVFFGFDLAKSKDTGMISIMQDGKVIASAPFKGKLH